MSSKRLVIWAPNLLVDLRTIQIHLLQEFWGASHVAMSLGPPIYPEICFSSFSFQIKKK